MRVPPTSCPPYARSHAAPNGPEGSHRHLVLRHRPRRFRPGPRRPPGCASRLHLRPLEPLTKVHELRTLGGRQRNRRPLAGVRSGTPQPLTQRGLCKVELLDDLPTFLPPSVTRRTAYALNCSANSRHLRFAVVHSASGESCAQELREVSTKAGEPKSRPLDREVLGHPPQGSPHGTYPMRQTA